MCRNNQKCDPFYVGFLCFIILITTESIFSDPLSVASIQHISTVSMEKGVDIISSIHEKSGHEHSKESFTNPQEYSAASKEQINMSSEAGDIKIIYDFNI